MLLSKAEINANILRNVNILTLTFATVRIVFIKAIIILIVHIIFSHRIKMTRVFNYWSHRRNVKTKYRI